MNTVLIVEDDHAVASALAAISRRVGCEATLCHSGSRAIHQAEQREFTIALIDIGLPDMTGLEVLDRLRAANPALPIVIITAHGSLENAIAAKRSGAAAYLLKPLDVFEVENTLRELLAYSPAQRQTDSAHGLAARMTGSSPAMQRCFAQIANAATSQAPVVITGPTGTGKTMAAHVIHTHSARSNGPFISLHCGALPEPLLESELFGHEKGAFTGASTARSGHIERANGGTLFLDEIADVSPATQAKLLRVLEEKTFVRVGGREDLTVDLRLITATNKNLRDEVNAGRFREDLYYRLHVLQLTMPPLCERRSDIPALTASLLLSIAPTRTLHCAPSTLETLARWHWPGNVRELRNALEHAAALCTGTSILPQHLPRELQEHRNADPTAVTELDRTAGRWLQQKLVAGATYREIHEELEAMTLRHLLDHFDGKPTLLARALGMNRVTLRRKQRLLKPGREN
jgi:DNA-binding NtrC family response regulator